MKEESEREMERVTRMEKGGEKEMGEKDMEKKMEQRGERGENMEKGERGKKLQSDERTLRRKIRERGEIARRVCEREGRMETGKREGERREREKGK